MTDERTPAQQAAMEKLMVSYLEKGAETDFKPYVTLMGEGLERCMKLVHESEKVEGNTASEILRSVVVFNHAYLEDFMRTLASAFLPTADEEALNEVPLAGLGEGSRAEKFFLGKLARHRGKTVNEVISQSVSDYMERSAFSNVTEIMSFLKSIGLKLSFEDDNKSKSTTDLPLKREILGTLDAMIQRRHHIVHRADRAKMGDGLQIIRAVDVMSWLVATLYFTLSAATTAFRTRHSFEEFEKKIDAMRETYKGAEEHPQS